MTEEDRLSQLVLAARQKIAEKEYWLEKLSGELVKSVLPPDFKSLASTGVARQPMETEDLTLDSELSQLLLKLASDSDTRLFIILAAAVNILVAKHTQIEDIILGVPIMGPNRVDSGSPGEHAAELINTVLPLRSWVKAGQSFKELLFQVRETVVEADEHRNYPVEVLALQLGHTEVQSGSGFPLFDIALLLENIQRREHLERFPVNLVLSFRRSDRQVTGHIEYNPAIYRLSSIERLVGHLQDILHQVLTDPGIEISEIEILSEDEKRQLLVDFNDIGGPYPVDQAVHRLFSEQAAHTPEALALVGSENLEKTRQYTYEELDEKTDRLAAALIKKGVQPGDIVGLLSGRTNVMILGMLAILKAGAAYLPLNPQNPTQRNAFILTDSAVRHLLTSRDLSTVVEPLALPGMEILYLEELSIEGVESPCIRPIASGLAYIIYTSGSTGNPKGVGIRHTNVSPILVWGRELLGLGCEDRSVQNLSYYFDWSVWEIFITLISGASLHMISEEMLLDSRAEIEFIEENSITVLHVTPTHFQYLLNACSKPLPLRHLAFGGEKLTYDLIQRTLSIVQPHCRIYNIYGPTEATITAAVLDLNRARMEDYYHLTSVPVGPTIANTTLYIYDRYMKICPIGVTGELYIGGDSLSPGYLNNPELTAERFYTSYWPYPSYAAKPLRGCTRRVLYKTGDLCRWLEDGTVEYLGRIDFQVKIRGNRVEIGEIENKILQHEAIREALVVAKQYENGENYLCAYLVVHDKSSPAIVASLREYLSAGLPGYMVPAYFVILERFPLNPNGKIDLKALPQPQARDGSDIPYVPPRTELEKIISSTWCEVLEVEKVGINDNFFDIGGNSLKIMKVNELLQERVAHLKVDTSVMSIFLHPTIAGMVANLEEQAKQQKSTPGLAQQDGTSLAPGSSQLDAGANANPGESAIQRNTAINTGRNRLRDRRKNVKRQ